MGINSVLLKMLLNSKTPIMLISEKMLMDDSEDSLDSEDNDLTLENALMAKPRKRPLPYIVPSPS